MDTHITVKTLLSNGVSRRKIAEQLGIHRRVIKRIERDLADKSGRVGYHREKLLAGSEQLLKDFRNRAVHDCWESYFGFEQCRHALCGAHLLRELTNLVEKGSKWAAKMHQFMLDLYRESRKATVISADRQTWEREFKYICQLADCEEPPPKQGKRGKPKNTRGRNLLNRLTVHQDGWLAFAFTEGVPFSNNQAERDIRCLKTKQKVATNFQTIKGAKHYARIQSFTSTLRKHSMNVFRHLIDVLDRKDIVFQAG